MMQCKNLSKSLLLSWQRKDSIEFQQLTWQANIVQLQLLRNNNFRDGQRVALESRATLSSIS